MRDSLQFVTHICLLGDDPSANLTPLADSSVASNRLIIVFQKNQEQAMQALKKVAKIRGHKVDIWLLPESQSTEQIKLSFLRLFEKELSKELKFKPANPGRQIWLNASNGSRQQVLSAYEVARSYQLPIFIVEPEKDALCWLYPEGRELTPLNDKIKLHEFFMVNSCEMVSQKNKQGIANELQELGNRWLAKADKLGTGLAKLNYLGAVAHGPKFVSRMDKSMLKEQSLQWLLDDLQKSQLIQVKGKDIHFKDRDTIFFCNGGWLEETTYGIVQSLAKKLPTIQDDGHSVEIERSINGQKVLNELDVVALVNNKLFVIECKTKQFHKGDGNNTLYKLDSLAERLGGIKAKAALVTFFPISVAEMRRAKELDIKIFVASDLPNLQQHVQKWLADL